MLAGQHNTSRGIALMVTTMLVFSIQDGISRHLAASYPPIFIVMMRYWGFALFVLAISAARPGGIITTARTHHPIVQFLRGLGLSFQICAVTFSFAALGLAETHAIMAINPLLVVAGGALLLGERVSPLQWATVAVGCVGILILIGPTSNLFDPLALIPLVCAIGFAGYQLATKWVGRNDPPQTSFFYTGIGGAVGMTVVGPFFWTNMAALDWALTVVLCITGAIGHFLLIKAYEAADASRLQPFAYLQLLLTTLIGVTLFGENLTTNVVVGAALIVAAGLVALRASKR